METTYARKNFCSCLSVLRLMMVLIGGLTACAKADTPSLTPSEKRVLIIHSYHATFEWTAELHKGMLSVLDKQSPLPQIHVEFMDSRRRYEDLTYRAMLADLYAHKYREHRFDVILCSDDNAYQFLLTYGDRIFPQTPIVFCGVNYFDPAAISDRPHITGIVESIDTQGTIDVIMRLHPKAKRIICLTDKSSFGKAEVAQARGLIHEERFAQCPIEFWDSFTYQELEQRLTALKPGDVVLFLTIVHLSDGTPFDTRRHLSALAEVCPVPIYGNDSHILGHGIIGGSLKNPFYHGQNAAEMALEVLTRRDGERIPVRTKQEFVRMFDYPGLQRYGIPTDVLPEGSMVINRPTTFYSKYARYVWSVAVVFAVLMAMIILLLSNILRRRQAEQRFRHIFNATSDAIFIHDAMTGDLLDVNRSMLEMYNCTREQALNMHPADFSSGEAPYTKKETMEWLKAAKDVGPQLFEWHAQKLSGEKFWTEVSLTRRDIAGQDCIVAVVRDITRRKADEKRLQEQAERLRQSEKMESIGQLAGGVAHDFNNMLGGIIGSAELLTMQMTDDDQHELINMILHCAKRAADLTQSLLTFSRRGTNQKLPVDLHQAVHEAVSILERSIDKNVGINVDLCAGDSSVLGSFAQLQNVVLNLGLNARDAMPDGGTITITTDHVREDDAPGPSLIRLCVRDTGTGIPADQLEKVFEPFFTTKEQGKGTGLGLATVYGTVKDHGGTIDVRSDPGKGTTFEIRLPINAQSESIPPDESYDAGRSNARVLLVDDEIIVREVTKQLLEDLGCHVVVAADGRSALELFTEKHDDIDIVIMDVIMPDMDGEQAFREMLAIDPDAKVVLCSGFAPKIDLEELQKAGLKSFITKPFRRAEISRVLASLGQR